MSRPGWRLPLWPARLCGRNAARRNACGDSRDRRARHHRWHRLSACIRAGCGCAHRPRACCGIGHVGQAGATGPPGRCPTRDRICAVQGAKRLCVVPGFDVPLAPSDRPALECDLDHTIPHADGGPTHASNLKCYCRTHHLVKTFWGWRDQQLPDGHGKSSEIHPCLYPPG